METKEFLELRVERSGEIGEEEKERRAIQKEKDRERRRLRDRQRRKSMSLEERAIHLARRRRNYQLRRQRAANAKLATIHQTAAESSSTSRRPSFDCGMQFGHIEVNQFQNQLDQLKHALVSGETVSPGRYRHPGVLRLTQMKQLLRLLKCSEKHRLGSEEKEEKTIPNGIPRKGIRLVHLKNLIRKVKCESSTTTDQNDSDNMQGREVEESSSMKRKNEGNYDRILLNENEKTIDAIDENKQICADGMCSL